MKLKPGVDIQGLQPEALLGLFIADGARRDLDRKELTVTSIKDGKHMKGSLHYKGLAFDVRTRDIGLLEFKERFKLDLEFKLGPQVDVVLEKTHMHIEFDPKA